jgi:hypothetical protein
MALRSFAGRLLQGERYLVHSVCGKDDSLASPSFPNLSVQLADVFDFPLEPGEAPPVVKEPPVRAYAAAPGAAAASAAR